MIRETRSRPRFRWLLALSLLALAALPARAEDDPFGGALFPPDLVLRHRIELEIDSSQVTAIKQEIQRVQPLFLDRQLDVQTELAALRELLETPRPDEGAVLAQLDRILDLEREIKRAQVALLVRIKRLLEPQQQERLKALRERE